LNDSVLPMWSLMVKKIWRFHTVQSEKFVFTVDLPAEAVWSFMNDRSTVASLFPGCTKVEILNDLDSLWTVNFAVGPFNRTLELRGHTTALIKNELIAWTVQHDLFRVSGSTILRKVTAEKTEISYTLEAEMAGYFIFIQEIVAGQKVKETARIFVENIKKSLAMLQKTKD